MRSCDGQWFRCSVLSYEISRKMIVCVCFFNDGDHASTNLPGRRGCVALAGPSPPHAEHEAIIVMLCYGMPATLGVHHNLCQPGRPDHQNPHPTPPIFRRPKLAPSFFSPRPKLTPPFFAAPKTYSPKFHPAQDSLTHFHPAQNSLTHRSPPLAIVRGWHVVTAPYACLQHMHKMPIT